MPLSKTGTELLFKVFSRRYESGSVLVISNLPFDEWIEVFGSERLIGALLDRLTSRTCQPLASAYARARFSWCSGLSPRAWSSVETRTQMPARLEDSADCRPWSFICPLLACHGRFNAQSHAVGLESYSQETGCAAPSASRLVDSIGVP